MITGYNTDVRHNNVVFHIQTEDKGLSNPFIESLIYVGGQVLVARRASYADLLAEGKDDQAILSLMERQHRVMIAAVRSGKFDGKLEDLMASRLDGIAAPAETGTLVTPPSAPPAEAPEGDAAPASAEGAPRGLRAPAPETAAGPPPATGSAVVPSPPTLDQVILDYLASEAEHEHLVLNLDVEGDLALGETARLLLKTVSSDSANPVVGARVAVKMISTVTEPVTLARGSTDGEGQLELEVQIPALGRGTAAMIISASSSLGNAEIKHLL